MNRRSLFSILICSGVFFAFAGSNIKTFWNESKNQTFSGSKKETADTGVSKLPHKVSTGHFKVEKIRDRWWFIDPEGNKTILLGVNHIGALRAPSVYDNTVFAKKYGQDWSSVNADIVAQLQGWGFNNLGYGQPDDMHTFMPYILTEKFIPSASFYNPDLVYTDVFDPAFVADADTKARAAARDMEVNPLTIAWTWDDCICWDILLTRKSNNTDWVSWIRALPANSPGRQRYTLFLKERHRSDVKRLNAAYNTDFASFEDLNQTDWSELDRDQSAVFADDSEFLRLIAQEYFHTISTTFRQYSPDGLLMGPRFHMRDYPNEVLEIAARYIDILGIQHGDQSQPALTNLKQADETLFDAAEIDRLYNLTGKPIVIVDHQCAFYDSQMPKTAPWHQYTNAEEAAASYDRFLNDAFSQPYIIGYNRCQYISVWNTDRKRYKQGLLRPDGTPFEDYVNRIAKTNKELIKTFQTGKSK